MIPLFSHMPEVAAPVLFPKRWDYIRSGLQINIERVRTYAQIYPTAVPSDHFLIRLLMSLAVPMSLSLARYYDAVDARAKGLSMAMEMTSSYAKGKVHPGVFYGAGCSEVLLLDEDYFDFMRVHDKWRQATPIRVVLHPKSDLNLLLPDGKAYSDEAGLAVVSINIAMLAVMYRAFTLEQTRKEDSLSPYQFIAAYVLPGMLPSHLDLAIFNRLCRLAFEEHDRATGVKRQHSFRVPNYTSYVDQALDYSVKTASEQHRSFLATLYGLPAISKLNQAQVLQMPDIYATSQVDWALWAARSKALKLLSVLCQTTAYATERTTLDRTHRAYAHNNVQGMIEQMLPDEVAADFFADLARFEQVLTVG